MASSKFMAALVVLVGVLGCIPVSLQPLFKADETMMDSKLIGTWQNSAEKKQWTFALSHKPKEFNYDITFYDEKGHKGLFYGNLGTINGIQCLNLFPSEEVIDWENPDKVIGNGYYWLHVVPVWGFLKVERPSEDELTLTGMDLDWLTTLLEANPELVAHQMVAERLVLTAATEELKVFIGKYLDNKDAFRDPVVYQRLAEPKPSETPAVPDGAAAPSAQPQEAQP